VAPVCPATFQNSFVAYSDFASQTVVAVTGMPVFASAVLVNPVCFTTQA